MQDIFGHSHHTCRSSRHICKKHCLFKITSISTI